MPDTILYQRFGDLIVTQPARDGRGGFLCVCRCGMTGVRATESQLKSSARPMLNCGDPEIHGQRAKRTYSERMEERFNDWLDKAKRDRAEWEADMDRAIRESE